MKSLDGLRRIVTAESELGADGFARGRLHEGGGGVGGGFVPAVLLGEREGEVVGDHAASRCTGSDRGGILWP